MPATTREIGGRGSEVFQGTHVSTINANETNQLKVGKGRLVKVLGTAVGNTWVADFYDDAAANQSQIWQWVTADGKTTAPLDIPFANGLRVVTSGTTPGALLVIWS